MFDAPIRNRFISNKTQANILMTQIRAENKKFASKCEPISINSYRDTSLGKKVFKENLYQTTCLDLHNEKRQSISPYKKGKRTGYQQLNGEKSTSNGKRKFMK